MTYHSDVFDGLDTDWAVLCHRHRRSTLLATWAESEPALAQLRQLGDVISLVPATRTVILAAVARLHVAGDDVAARTLLQLLVPGLIRLTAKWRSALDNAGEAVVSAAWTYISYLRDPNRAITCSPAGYVLRSVDRELLAAAKAATAARAELTTPAGTDQDDPSPGTPAGSPARSAEDTFFGGGRAISNLLGAAVTGKVISSESARMAWLVLAGEQVHDAAARTGGSTSTYFRHRARLAALLPAGA